LAEARAGARRFTERDRKWSNRVSLNGQILVGQQTKAGVSRTPDAESNIRWTPISPITVCGYIWSSSTGRDNLTSPAGDKAR
jgi:hypothetical protein